LVRKELRKIAKFLGLVAGFLTLLRDIFADLPKQRFGGGSVFEVEIAEIKKGKGFFLFLGGVVKTFQAAEFGLVLEHDLKVLDDLVFDLRLMLLAERLTFVDALENFDHEQ
jgi:hypothetical protein